MRPCAVVVALSFAALLPSGSAFSQPQINIQTANTEFRDIVLGTPATGTLSIGRLALTGLKTDASRVRATRAEFHNLVVVIGTSRTEIPSIAVTDFSAPTALFNALSKGGSLDLNWASLVEATSTAEIKIPVAKLRDTASRAEAEYADFNLTNLTGGIAQSSRIALSRSKTVTPTADEISSTVGETIYEKINVAELVRFFTGGGAGDAKSLVERMTIASFVMKMPQAEVDLGKLEIKGFVGRAPAMAMPLGAIQAMSGAMPDLEKGPNAQKLAAYYREVLQHLRVERYAFTGAKVQTPLGPVALGDIVMENFSGNGMGRFSIAGTTYASPVGSFKLGEFEIKGFNWKGLLDLGLEAAASGKEPDIKPERIMSLIPSLDALRFANITAGTPFGPFSLDEFRVEMPAGAKGVPESVAMTIKALKADVAKLPPFAPLADELKALGYGALTANAQVNVRFNPTERTMLLEAPSIDISEVGKVDFAVRVTNVGPEGADDIDEAPVESLSLGITDGGLGARAFRLLAQGAGISPDAMRAAMAVEAKTQAVAMFGPALTPGSAEVIEEFVKNGQRIVLTMKPKPGATVKLGELSGPPGPEVLNRLTVTIAKSGAAAPLELRQQIWRQ